MRLSGEFPCPACKKTFPQFIDEMIPGNERTCPNCKETIRFSGDDGRKAQEAVDGLIQKVRELKTRKITLGR
jgi:hydrogenase maturation factor HypF (carbamoyltransferase family)